MLCCIANEFHSLLSAKRGAVRTVACVVTLNPSSDARLTFKALRTMPTASILHSVGLVGLPQSRVPFSASNTCVHRLKSRLQKIGGSSRLFVGGSKQASLKPPPWAYCEVKRRRRCRPLLLRVEPCPAAHAAVACCIQAAACESTGSPAGLCSRASGGVIPGRLQRSLP